MKFRIFEKNKKYYVQCKRHWYSMKWKSAPVIGYWCHAYVKRNLAFFDDKKEAQFIKENLEQYSQKYKGCNIYPVFDWTDKNYFSGGISDTGLDYPCIIFQYKLKGFSFIKSECEDKDDIINYSWKTVDDVKRFIDNDFRNKNIETYLEAI